jgi:hypothetical protein
LNLKVIILNSFTKSLPVLKRIDNNTSTPTHKAILHTYGLPYSLLVTTTPTRAGKATPHTAPFGFVGQQPKIVKNYLVKPAITLMVRATIIVLNPNDKIPCNNAILRSSLDVT